MLLFGFDYVATPLAAATADRFQSLINVQAEQYNRK